MKRFDDSTKKLIKNIVALATSAFMLIAATVAWFTVRNEANITGLPVQIISNSFTATYQKMTNPADVVLTAATTGAYVANGTNPSAFTFSNSMTPAGQMSQTWTASSDWSITSLFPGEYSAFRILFSAYSQITPKLIIEGITCKDLTGADTLTSAQKTTVYDNVYLYAAAITSSGGQTPTYTVVDSVCNNFSSLMDSNGKISVTWHLPANTSDLIILLDIGIPGATVNSSSTRTNHDALRQIGATLAFTSVRATD